MGYEVVIRREAEGGYEVVLDKPDAAAMLAGRLVRQRLGNNEGVLNLHDARRAAAALRKFGLTVDDRVLATDARMKQWADILLIAIVPGGIAVTALAEWSWAPFVLVFLAGLLIGGWMRHVHERDGAMIPSPLGVVKGAAFGAWCIAGFGVLMGGMFGLSAKIEAKIGALPVVVGSLGFVGLSVAGIALYNRGRRLRDSNKASGQQAS